MHSYIYIFVTSVHEIWSLLLLHLHHLQIKCTTTAWYPALFLLPQSLFLLLLSLFLSFSVISLLFQQRSFVANDSSLCVCVLIVNNLALFALLMQLFRFAVSVSFSVVVLVVVLHSVVVCGFHRSLAARL